MKTDIQNREDIILLVNTFYDKVQKDEELGHIFNGVAKIDWQAHLPKMYDFWENIVFGTGGYSGNVMQPHMRLDQKHRLEHDNFVNWLMLFTSTVNELFEGVNAEGVKERATQIAGLMEFKVASVRKE